MTMKKVRYRCMLTVAAILLYGGGGRAEANILLNLSAHVNLSTCDLRISNSNPVSYRELSRAAFPLSGGVYRAAGFAPVRVIFTQCATNQSDMQGTIRLHAGSVGTQDERLASRGLWGAGGAGVGFDVLVRASDSRWGIAHRMTPDNNELQLNHLRHTQSGGQEKDLPAIDVESRLRSYVKRENITPGVVKTVLLLSAVYG
ncbi:hypothetical protein D3Z09_18320 [Rahnella aquatilis]|nr:hypothetical protein D3Z09_18320 [Rahnella aquatilis]